MLIRILIAVAALGAMSLTALAQTPEANEATRKATAKKLINGQTACEGCDLFQVDLSYKELPGLNLSHARLRQADLSLSTFDKSKFTGANLSIVNAFGLRAEHTDFSKADFSDATLVGGTFGETDFTDAKFDNANLSGSDFQTAKGLNPASTEHRLWRRHDQAAERPQACRLQELASTSKPAAAPSRRAFSSLPARL